MIIKNNAEEARHQLEMISELPDGWGYLEDDTDEGNPAYKKEFIKYCSKILERIIDTFGESKVPFISPIWNGTAIQMEYEETYDETIQELGYLEFEIHDDYHIEILYVPTNTGINVYKKCNEAIYYDDIENVIIDCIKKYFDNNLHNNFPNKSVQDATNEHLHKPFKPILPGETIKDLIDDRNISVYELVTKLDMKDTEIDDLLNGTLKIDTALSLKLQEIFDVASSFWMNLQNNYDEEVSEYGKVFRSTETGNKQMDEE